MLIKKLTHQTIIFVALIGGILFAPAVRAIECFDEDNCSKQVKKFTKYARYGSPHAQILLAALYYEGELVEQDFKKSFRLYQKAAKQKPTIGIANHKLALAYLDGKGTTRNSRKAIKYLKKASKVGYVNSQTLLGLLYFEGKDADKDLLQAKKFFSLAAQSNDPRAQFMLGQMAEYGLAGDKNPEEAQKLYSIAASRNYEKAIQKLRKDSLFPQAKKSVKTSENKLDTPSKQPVDTSKGEVMVIYGNDLPVIEMMDIALSNIKDMKVYNSQWTGSHIPGRGCGDGMSQCTIITDPNLIWNMINGN